MTAKFIHYTLEDYPWMVNVQHLMYLRYKPAPGKYCHTLCYRLNGESNDKVIFYSKTKEALGKVYADILKFIADPDMPVWIIKESDGDLPVPEILESRRLETV